MNTRYLINWSVWIGVASAIYCFLYTLTPLINYGVMCASFTALPIFFTGGASRKEYFNYGVSNVVGVLWGLVYLWFINLIIGTTGAALANGISVGLFTIILCALHFVPFGKTWMNKPAAMFGAISSTFWIGGDMQKVPALMITLVLGVTLGLICQEGTNFLDEEGRWKLPSKKSGVSAAEES